jgi:hypothetical protein
MKLHNAIFELNSSVVSIGGETAYDFNGNEVTYDKIAVQSYIDANAYKGKRAADYPSIPDQLDLLYHGGMDAWKAAIQAVKDKYPKG